MAIFNNRYYPDEHQATWTDIASLSWAEADLDWVSANANLSVSSTPWSFTSNVTDLGSAKWFYPLTRVEWDDSEPVTISYQASLDDSTYTTYSAEPMYARYLKTTINTAGAYLSSISTVVSTEPIIETYHNLDTTSLSGNVTHRTLNTNNFSKIQSVTITSAPTESRPIAGQIVADNTGNVVIRAIDLDTWDKVAVNANVNIVVVGFPRLEANTTQGIVVTTL